MARFFSTNASNDLIVWKYLHRNGCLILISEVNSNILYNYQRLQCIFNCCVIENVSLGIAWNWVNHDDGQDSVFKSSFVDKNSKWGSKTLGWTWKCCVVWHFFERSIMQIFCILFFSLEFSIFDCWTFSIFPWILSE